MRTRIFTLLAAIVGFTIPAAAQKMSARQLFYDDGKSPAVAKPVVKKTPARAKEKPTSGKEALASTPVVPSTAQMVNANYMPLAIRYSVLRFDDKVEVTEDTVFHSGDKIQVQLTANQDGFLYIISKGSSGKWIPLFPDPDVHAGSNRIIGRKAVFLPSEEHAITFDGIAGLESLFIIFAANPVSDVDELLQRLKQPENAKAPLELAKTSAPMETMVSNYRKVYSRDLLIERVKKTDEKAPKVIDSKPMNETAVYVAAATTGPGSRVVVDLRLRHE